jgi:hypothetical protein
MSESLYAKPRRAACKLATNNFGLHSIARHVDAHRRFRLSALQMKLGLLVLAGYMLTGAPVLVKNGLLTINPVPTPGATASAFVGFRRATTPPPLLAAGRLCVARSANRCL